MVDKECSCRSHLLLALGNFGAVSLDWIRNRLGGERLGSYLMVHGDCTAYD